MVINTKFKIYLTIGLSALINGAIIIFLVLPFQQKIIDLNSQITDNRQKIADLQTQRETLIISGRNYLKLQSNEINRIQQIFISKDKLIELIDNLEQIAQTEQVELQLSINEEEMKSDGDGVTVDFSVTGAANKLVSYLNKLEQQNFYLDYQSIIITPQTTGGPTLEAPTVTTGLLQITAKIYWL